MKNQDMTPHRRLPPLSGLQPDFTPHPRRPMVLSTCSCAGCWPRFLWRGWGEPASSQRRVSGTIPATRLRREVGLLRRTGTSALAQRAAECAPTEGGGESGGARRWSPGATMIATAFLARVGRATDACPLHRIHGVPVTIFTRPGSENCSGRDVRVAHLAEHLHQRRPHKNDPPPRRITSLSGARPDMEHTRLGTNARRRSRLAHAAGAPAPDRRPRQDRHGQVHPAAIDRGARHRPRRWRAADRSARHAWPKSAWRWCRRQRRNQVCFFDLADSEYPIAFNIFADVHAEDREFLAEGIVSAMYTIWNDSWGPQLERILRNSLIVLLDSPGTSFLHIPRFLTDPEFRERIVQARQEPSGARVLRGTVRELAAGFHRDLDLAGPQQGRGLCRQPEDPQCAWDRSAASCTSSMRSGTAASSSRNLRRDRSATSRRS